MIYFTEKKPNMYLWRGTDFAVYLKHKKGKTGYKIKFIEYVYKNGGFHKKKPIEIKGVFDGEKTIGNELIEAIQSSPQKALSKTSAQKFLKDIKEGKYTFDFPKGAPVFKLEGKKYKCSHHGIDIEVESVGTQMMVTVQVGNDRRRYGGEKQNPELMIASAMQAWTDMNHKNHHFIPLLKMIKQGTVKWER